MRHIIRHPRSHSLHAVAHRPSLLSLLAFWLLRKCNFSPPPLSSSPLPSTLLCRWGCVWVWCGGIWCMHVTVEICACAHGWGGRSRTRSGTFLSGSPAYWHGSWSLCFWLGWLAPVERKHAHTTLLDYPSHLQSKDLCEGHPPRSPSSSLHLQFLDISQNPKSSCHDIRHFISEDNTHLPAPSLPNWLPHLSPSAFLTFNSEGVILFLLSSPHFQQLLRSLAYLLCCCWFFFSLSNVPPSETF